MKKLESHYQRQGETYLVEIKLNHLSQLFNSLDPSPFLEKDLDEKAENYIFGSVSEFPLVTPLKLVFYLPTECQQEAGQILPEALHNYFDYCQQGAQRRLRATWRQGRATLLIGLSFLFVCLSLSELVSQLGNGTLVHFLEEGLLISGWVAMWRPLEIFLYQWWPLRHQQKIFAKLTQISIEIRLLEERAKSDQLR